MRQMRRLQIANNCLAARWMLGIVMLLLIQLVEGAFNFGTPVPSASPSFPTMSPTQTGPITAIPTRKPTPTSASRNPSTSPSKSPTLYGVCSTDADCPGRFVCFTNQTRWVTNGDAGILFNCGCPRGRIAQYSTCALKDPPMSDPVSIWGIILLVASSLETLSYGRMISSFRVLSFSDVESSSLVHAVVNFFICTLCFVMWLSVSLVCDLSPSSTFLDGHKYCDAIEGQIVTGIISAVACMNGVSHSLCFWRRSANRRNDNEPLVNHGSEKRDALLVNLITGLLGFGFVTPFSIFFPRLTYWALLPFKVLQCVAMVSVFRDLQTACKDDREYALETALDGQIDDAEQNIVNDQAMAIIKRSPAMSHRNASLIRVVKVVGILYSCTVIAAVICFQRMMDNYSFEYTDDENGSRDSELILKVAQTLLLLALQALNRYQKRIFARILEFPNEVEPERFERPARGPLVQLERPRFPNGVFAPVRDWGNLPRNAMVVPNAPG